MPTWCHMFNFTLTGNARVWFDDLPQESIDSYDDLKKAFLENYLQQKKCIKDPVEIHNIKQRDGESTKEFVRRYKLECRDEKGAPKCMKISRFMHEIINPELIKRLYDKIPNHENSKKLDRSKTSRNDASGTNKGQSESRIVGHTTDECMHLKRQIEEMLKAGKLSHLIKELKQSNGKDEAKAAKKRETLGKEKPLAILMVQPWQRVAKQRITQTFSPDSVISFPPLGEEYRTKGPMIIEADMGGQFVHRMYVNGGSSSEILYEHYFNRFRPEVRSQMVPAATPLVGFSEEIIWPLGKISLLVKICNKEHSTSAWMNVMVVRSPYPYNRIIGRTGVRRIKAVPSTAHRMTRSAAARNQPSHRRKNSGSNSPRVSETNYSNRLYPNRRRAEGDVQYAKAQP
ncbi:reverse transcriptase domain-containing protein [Tanacetum coccineum]